MPGLREIPRGPASPPPLTEEEKRERARRAAGAAGIPGLRGQTPAPPPAGAPASAPAFNPPAAQPPAQPPAQPLQTGPPASPEEHEARKEGWRGFIRGLGERFQNDPDFRSFMFNMGTRLMQPYSPNQTALGHLGASLQGAQNYSGALASQRAAGRQSAAELALKEREVTETERRGQTQSELDKARATRARAMSTSGTAASFAKDMNRTTFVAKMTEANALLPSKELEGMSTDEMGQHFGEMWDELNRGRSGAELGAEAEGSVSAELNADFPDAPEGAVATDDSTGERYVKRGGTWVRE